MSGYQDFSSLPPAEEQAFAVYEQRSVESGKKAMIMGIIISAIFFVVTVGIVFSQDRLEKGHQMAGDDMGTFSDKRTGNEPAAQPTEAAAPATAETPTTPAEEAEPAEKPAE